jgi:hypothetical protein
MITNTALADTIASENTRSFNCPFVIAEWDNDAKVFYSESFDYPIPVWDCWKLIARNNILENPKYKDTLGKMALNGQIITNDEKATETE